MRVYSQKGKAQDKKRALEMNMLSLRQDGIQKLLNGVTTIEEVFRVTMK